MKLVNFFASDDISSAGVNLRISVTDLKNVVTVFIVKVKLRFYLI